MVPNERYSNKSKGLTSLSFFLNPKVTNPHMKRRRGCHIGSSSGDMTLSKLSSFIHFFCCIYT